jgi:hypothetical protein
VLPLQLSGDSQQPELVRLYSFSVAVAGLKRFHAARAAAVAGGFPATNASFLQFVLDGPHAEDSIFVRDPCEQLKALATAAEGLYLIALTNKQGDYTLASSQSSSSTTQNGDSSPSTDPAAAVAAAVAAGATLGAMQRSMEGLPILQEIRAGPLLSKSMQKLWKVLQDREGFVYTTPVSIAAREAEKAAGGAAGGSDNGDSSSGAEKGGKAAGEQQEETEEERDLKAAAEDAIAMANVTFDENWHMFLKAVYDTEFVPVYAGVGMQLAAALLQLLAHKVWFDWMVPVGFLQFACHQLESAESGLLDGDCSVSCTIFADSHRMSHRDAVKLHTSLREASLRQPGHCAEATNVT